MLDVAAPPPRMVFEPAARRVESAAHRDEDVVMRLVLGRVPADSDDLARQGQLDPQVELLRRPLRAVAAHPGYSHTNLQGATGRQLSDTLMLAATRVFATDADFGARQTLYAASQYLPGDTFVGPRFGSLGRTQPVGRSRAARDAATATALWELSEQLTGTKFPL